MAGKKSYQELIRRLETRAQRSPVRYRVQLLLLALAGYAVIVLALLLSFGTLAAMLLYQIIARPDTSGFVAVPVVLLLLFGGTVLHAIRFRLEMPEGYLLQPEDAPGLWQEMERLRREAHVPPLHGILITADFNAAAIFVPDGLWFKPHRHYLMLGLPLLQLLDRRQLAAVIAHEFGHFGDGHGRFTVWVYRLRLSWYRLLEGLSRQGAGLGWLFIFFYRWYAPYFDAYSLVFARNNEYGADRVAAFIVDAPALAAALVRIELGADWIQYGFLTELSDMAKRQPHPPLQPYRNLIDGLLASERARARMLSMSLHTVPEADATHPSLVQRLSAIGIAPDAIDSDWHGVKLEFSDALLERLERHFNQQWRDRLESQWRENHRQGLADQRRLAELDALPLRNDDQTLEYACLIDDYWPGLDPLPLYRDVLRNMPNSALAHYRLGRLLLKRDQEAEAVAHLRQAMELDVYAIESIPVCLRRYLLRKPEGAVSTDAVEALYKQCIERTRDLRSMDESDADVQFIPHDLDAAALQSLTRLLAGFDKIRAAWVVRKREGGMANPAGHYFILLDWSGSVVSESSGLSMLIQRIDLPGQVFLFTGTDNSKRAKAVKRIAGEPFYRRR